MTSNADISSKTAAVGRGTNVIVTFVHKRFHIAGNFKTCVSYFQDRGVGSCWTAN
jgi:hypothetical protein